MGTNACGVLCRSAPAKKVCGGPLYSGLASERSQRIRRKDARARRSFASTATLSTDASGSSYAKRQCKNSIYSMHEGSGAATTAKGRSTRHRADLFALIAPTSNPSHLGQKGRQQNTLQRINLARGHGYIYGSVRDQR